MLDHSKKTWFEDKPLHTATFHAQLDAIKELVTLGADIEGRQRTGQTPLHLACVHRGLQKPAKLLLELGAKPTARDENAWTPLHGAARGELDIVQNLLHKNNTSAFIESRSVHGDTALHVAARDQMSHNFAMLLRAGANVRAVNGRGYNVLHYASETGNASTVGQILDHPGGSILINLAGPWGHKPLHRAAEKGHAHIALTLIGHGADVRSEDACGKGDTPLHLAAEHGHEKAIMVLVESADGQDLVFS